MKSPRGLGLLGVASAVAVVGLAGVAPAMAQQQGIYINGGSSDSCTHLRADLAGFGVSDAAGSAANLLRVQRNNNCAPGTAATQTNRVLFYGTGAGQAASGAKSLSLGGELHVNGGAITMLGGIVITAPTGNGIRIGADGATSSSSLSLGNATNASGNASVALGFQATSSGEFATAIGNSTNATAPYALAFGAAAQSWGDRSMAFGASSVARGDSSVAIGRFAQSIGPNSVGVGRSTIARGADSTALGFGATTRGANTLAIGAKSSAESLDSVAIGLSATSNHDFSVALGANAATSGHRTVAPFTLNGTTYRFLPEGLTASNAIGVVSVGTAAQSRQIINVAPGVIDATSYDAVNGSQLFAAYTEINNLAGRVASEDAKLQAQLDNLPRGGGAESVLAAVGPGASVDGNGNLVLPPFDLSSVGTSMPQPTTLLGAVDALDMAVKGLDEALGIVWEGAILYNPAEGVHAFDAKGEKITNVADGAIAEGSTDAINGGQLHALGERIGDAGQQAAAGLAGLGGGASVAADGTVTAPSYEVATINADGTIAPAGSTHNNVGGALDAIGDNIVNLAGAVGEQGTDIAALQQNALLWDDGAGAFTAERDGAPQQIANVAAGVAATDAVNVSQLEALGEEAEGAMRAAQAAQTAANTAQTTAEGAQTAAAAAQGTANAAQTAANTAQGTAEAAQTAANTAQTTAEGAQTAAATAQGAAEAAQAAANDADRKGVTALAGLGGGAAVGADGTAILPSYSVQTIGDDASVGTSATHNNVGDALDAIGENVINLAGIAVEQGEAIEKLNKNALLWSDEDNSFTAERGDAPQRIANVAAGVADTDAVNLSQLKTVDQRIDEAFTLLNVNPDGQIQIGSGSDATEVNFAGRTPVTGPDGAPVFNEDGTPASVARDRTLTGVADGVNASDAVNRGQLDELGSSVAAALGGGATLNPDGTVNAPAYAIAAIEPDGTVAGNPTIYNNAGDALKGLEGSLGVVNNRVNDLAEDSLLWDEQEGAFNAKRLASDTNRIANVSAGVNETDAVNLSQLEAVNDEAHAAQNTANAALGAAGNAQETADDALTLAQKAEAQLVGIGANETVAGRIAAASQSAAAALGGGASVNPDGTVNAPSYQVAAISADGVKQAPISYGNTGEALTALDGNIGTVNNRVDDLAELQAGSLTYDKKADGTRANKVTLFGGDPNAPVVIGNVADAKNATDAVNLRQLSEARQEIDAQDAEYARQARAHTDQTKVAVINESRSYADQVGGKTLSTSMDYTDKVASGISGDIVTLERNVNEAVGSLAGAVDEGFNRLNSSISEVRGEARRAAAIGLAASSLRFDDNPGKLSVAMGAGAWRGAGAAAFGVGYTSETGNLRANVTGVTSAGQFGVGAGVSITLN
ncbi:YadA-like family protein [Ochrobactrum sp. AN78]|uniref:YadA-like family protein n=1 Tax=Ochrobactrum sp. AN78 TaxID=3039853 RepID=UPI002989DD9A|nr:YadA-like family protein [Ochrobactrum sp. AN78]